MKMILKLVFFSYLSLFSCEFLCDEGNVTTKLNEYKISHMIVNDISYRKGVLALCAATTLQPTVFTSYVFNFTTKKLAWHSDHSCDSVAVNSEGKVSILRNNIVYNLDQYGNLKILNSGITARDFAYSHGTNTLYYTEPSGLIRKYENSVIVNRDGLAVMIDANSKGETFVINSVNNLFSSKFGQGQVGGWEFIQQGFKDIATCENGEVFLINNQDGFIYQYINKQFVIFNDHFKFVSISCDTSSSDFYAVKENRELYKVSPDVGNSYEKDKVFLIDISTRNNVIVGCGRINFTSNANYVFIFDQNLNASFVGNQLCNRVAVSSAGVISAVIRGILRSYINNSWKTISLENQIKDLAYTHKKDSDALYLIDTLDPEGVYGGGAIRRFEKGVESSRDGRAFFIDTGNNNEIAVVNSVLNLFHNHFDKFNVGWFYYSPARFTDVAICGNNTIVAISPQSIVTFKFNPTGNLTADKTIKSSAKAVTCGDTEANIYVIEDVTGKIIKIDI